MIAPHQIDVGPAVGRAGGEERGGNFVEGGGDLGCAGGGGGRGVGPALLAGEFDDGADADGLGVGGVRDGLDGGVGGVGVDWLGGGVGHGLG